MTEETPPDPKAENSNPPREGEAAAAAFAADSVASEHAADGAPAPVRDAGPTEMRDEVDRDWDAIDQQSDESFPASDPPANY